MEKKSDLSLAIPSILTSTRRHLGLRGVLLFILAAVAGMFVLRWASAVFIPLMLGVMLSYALSPIVARMVRLRIPRAIAAAVLLLGVIGGIGATIYSFGDDAAALVESLPDAAQKLRQSFQENTGKPGPIEQVQKAAEQLEKAAEESRVKSPLPSRGVTRVQVERPKFNIKDYLWNGTVGLFGLAGQAIMVCFLTYFLIVSGDTFRRKLVKLAGPTLTQKKITVQTLDDITAQIQRYLLVQIFTSVLVGIVTWIAFLWIGVEHAAVWGMVAGVLNFIPYLGAMIVTGGSALIAFLQFGTVNMVLLVAGVSSVIHVIEGHFLTPWMTSRACRMSPVVVFVGMFFWGWLWGVWGFLLGLPILMAIKTVCDHVEDLKPIGELLGD